MIKLSNLQDGALWQEFGVSVSSGAPGNYEVMCDGDTLAYITTRKDFTIYYRGGEVKADHVNFALILDGILYNHFFN